MELLIFCLLCSVGLAVSGSLTFWPVQNWWDFYIPIVLAIAGYVVAMLIIILCYTIFGLFIDQKKEYKKVSKFAAFWFVLGVKYVNLLAGVRVKVIGKEKLPRNQRFVMVCNHRSNFDPMVTAVALAKYDLAFITKYAHLRSVKIYVAMNTILYDNELSDAYHAVDELANIGIDAIIVQDLALLYYITNHYSSLEAHISTQAGIDDLDGIKVVKSLGAKRVVLAREVSLEKIKEFTIK